MKPTPPPRQAADGYGARQRVARFGEALAAMFLEERGARILNRNVRVGRGEIDLHADVAGTSVAVEVKTVVAMCSGVDPMAQFSEHKAQTVRRYAVGLSPPAYRVDLVAVSLRRTGADIRWVPFVG